MPSEGEENLQQPARADTSGTSVQDVSRTPDDVDTTAVEPAVQPATDAQAPAAGDTMRGPGEDVNVAADRDPASPAAETPALPDSAAQTYDRVLDVLAYLVARYPESPEADRAQSMGVAIADAYPGSVISRPLDAAGEAKGGEDDSEAGRQGAPSDSVATVPAPGGDAPDAAPADRTAPRDSVAGEPSAPAYRFDVPPDSARRRGPDRERAPTPQTDTTATDSIGSVPLRVPADSSRNGG